MSFPTYSFVLFLFQNLAFNLTLDVKSTTSSHNDLFIQMENISQNFVLIHICLNSRFFFCLVIWFHAIIKEMLLSIMNNIDNITDFLSQNTILNQSEIDNAFAMLYPEVKHIANSQLAKMFKNPEITPTLLVNECYLKLKNSVNLEFKNKKHFYSLVARCMRFYLIDMIRKQHQIKHQFNTTQFSITQIANEENFTVDLIELDHALNQLKSIDSNLLNIIELRFFAGFSLDEIANLLNTNKTKIYRQWLLAKSLLLNLIDENNG